jgi:hypothetical protein
MRGFEGAPGHGAAPLVKVQRGYYGANPGAASFPGYPLHSYRTWGGYDYYVAQVGGLWDSLLGEGRAFYITANSDAHRYYGDKRAVDRSTYAKLGYVTPDKSRTMLTDRHNPDEDYLPGAYARTYVHAEKRHPMAILDGMRAGNMWTVQGGLVEGCELYLHDGQKAAPMGSTLPVKRGADVEVVLRVRPARRPNLGGQVPVLHHVDLILGEIFEGAAKDGAPAYRDAMHHPTARVIAQLSPAAAERRGGGAVPWLEFRHRIKNVQKSFFLRVRGTNSDVVSPRLDLLHSDPFGELWFYGNPVMVRLPPA